MPQRKTQTKLTQTISNIVIENIDKKALYVNHKKFYILESTAKNSKIGFPLKYQFEEIEAIVDPFINKKLVVSKIEYK